MSRLMVLIWLIFLILASGAIPIVPMKQEVKPDLSAAATAEQQELPPAAVTAIKEEVEQTPSGKNKHFIVKRVFYGHRWAAVSFTACFQS